MDLDFLQSPTNELDKGLTMLRRSFLMLVLLLATANAYSSVHTVTGQVALLRSHEAALGPDGDWFSLEGIAAAGSCLTYNGLVVIRIRDDGKGQRQFAILLSAKASGASIQATVDDTVKDALGYCFVRYLDAI